MTRSDKWKKRDCVLRYRAWCDVARAAAPAHLPERPSILAVTAYLPFPESWSQKKKEAHKGQPHQTKPDWDNIAKSVGDALWGEDSTIYKGSCTKLWDDGEGPRVEISVR
jgi:Holliday junction resolvase RusA-like endonuclease